MIDDQFAKKPDWQAKIIFAVCKETSTQEHKVDTSSLWFSAGSDFWVIVHKEKKSL